jgi:hypothetical protein
MSIERDRMTTGSDRRNEIPGLERNSEIRISQDRLVAVLTIALVSGLVFGSAAMFYAMRTRILGDAFDPAPIVAFWLFLLAVWGIGRLFRHVPSRRSVDATGDVSSAVQDLDRRI